MDGWKQALWRLATNLWVLVIALPVGIGAAWGSHLIGFDKIFPDIGSRIADAVIAAFSSGAPVYLVALTVQISEISRATQKAAQKGIVDGVLGELHIGNLRTVVRDEMTKLPHKGGDPKRHVFILDSKTKFDAAVRAAGTDFEAVALALVAFGAVVNTVEDEAYNPDSFNHAVDLLWKTFDKTFAHILVLDRKSQNIVAAVSTEAGAPGYELRLKNKELVSNLLDAVRNHPSSALHHLGFSTEIFEVTKSPRELFRDFAHHQVSSALLAFDRQVVSGVIPLWKLVELSVKRPT